MLTDHVCGGEHLTAASPRSLFVTVPNQTVAAAEAMLLNRTAKRARDLWDRAGRPQGRSTELWDKAQAEIKAEIDNADPLRNENPGR